MKKLASTKRKPARRKRGSSPRETLFAGLDMKLIRQLLAEELDFEEESLEDIVDEFLSSEPDALEDMPDADTMTQLADELDRLRVDANGGDPQARETLKSVREKIDKAARRDDIHPGILILLGRLFSGAQVDIGDAARASMDRVISAGLFCGGEEAYRLFVRPALLNLEGDPFTVQEEIRSMIGIFPVSYKAALVEALAVEGDPRGRRCAIGFLLAPEEPLALAAVRGLSASVARRALDADCRRRIDMIRAWLPPSLREALDAAIPAVSAGPRPAAQFVKAIVSVCDGSGAAALLATMKLGSRYSVAAVMTKPWGVADSFLVPDLTKGEAVEIERGATVSTPTAEVPFAVWTRLVRLALGRNLARGAPPPFELVRTLESIGLDSLAPDLATPAEIIDHALAATADRDDAETIAEAHKFVGDSDAAGDWFEASDAIDDVLKATGSVNEGAQALLEDYLPNRRAFWASQCALSALALQDRVATREGSWKHLALVGRDLLRGVPLHDIPLMRQIADRSATAYFMQH
ncbi:MAG TPA: hypothetical protein VFE63_01410 [Roseiarcus sp.]|jgi:hypothetical protein|nr:hypothetical protein [Roseiarcus sp.]